MRCAGAVAVTALVAMEAVAQEPPWSERFTRIDRNWPQAEWIARYR
jgi:hypothetical protein